MEEIPIYKGKLKNILVISGGGIKGYCALGAITKLKELGIIDQPDVYCGTSIGSSIALLLCIGYTSDDIYNILMDIDASMLTNYNIDTLLNDAHFGFANLDSFFYILGMLMKKKKISPKITFKKLFDKVKKKLIITGVCINTSSLHYFNHIDTPNMEVLTAVRISSSIPIVFKPVIYNDKAWIDGGCLNNYPIDYFKDKLDDVIGILLEDNIRIIDNFEDIPTYITQLVKCLLRNININKYDIYKKQTILIKISTDASLFDINNDEKKKLYNYGYDIVDENFSL
jgi:NTE family protein